MADAELGAGPWAAILVTSANAARAIAAHKRVAELRALPVLAVGERSADAMRSAGFADVSSAEGAASDLTRLASERLKHGEPLLYLAGADRSSDIAADLAAQNFLVRTVVVYRAVQANALPAAAAEVLKGGIDGVLHFSRRSAEAYVNATRAAGLSEPAIKKLVHFCLSAQVAEPLTRSWRGGYSYRQRADRGGVARAYSGDLNALISLASRPATCCRHLCRVLCRGE